MTTTQATLELLPRLPGPLPRGDDGTGFAIGWDHARHSLVPPPELLLGGSAVGQGWRAARAVLGRRSLRTSPATRQWLALRTRAWREEAAFDEPRLTPTQLAQLHTAHCPVLRTVLGGAPGQDEAAVFERLNPQAPYAAGNLVMMSRRAAKAQEGLDGAELLRRARRAQRSGEAVDGLDAGAWWRLAALRSQATPLPFHEAARLPLAVLPPAPMALPTAVQRLQALLTQQFTAAGWSTRTRELAGLVADEGSRHDFNLFVGALAPRVLEAGRDTRRLRLALEDAWLQERVQRRWQHFVLGLGAATTEALLDRAMARRLLVG